MKKSVIFEIIFKYLILLSLGSILFLQVQIIENHSQLLTIIKKGVEIAEEIIKTPEGPGLFIPSKVLTITAYSQDKKETDANPENTAVMKKPIAGWTCAVSKDMIHWLGGRVYIEGLGVRLVNDLMNERHANHLDIFTGNKKLAKNFGRKTMNVVFLGK